MDIEMLRYISAKTGLGLNYISKDEKISYLLTQLQEIFGEKLVLKGGTALNRVYLSKKGVSRFSEDIDVDYFGSEALNNKIENIKRKMKNITDFEVKGPRILHRTLQFDCYYVNELGNRDRVMLEIYLSEPPYLNRQQSLVKSPFIDTHPTIFSVYSLEDLFARKMVALYNRTEGKDIYDIFHTLSFDFKREYFEKSLSMNLKFYKIKGNFYQGLIEKLNESEKNARYIGNSTNHFIPIDLRPNWRVLIITLKKELLNLFEFINNL